MKKKQMIGAILGAIFFVLGFVILAHNIGVALLGLTSLMKMVE